MKEHLIGQSALSLGRNRHRRQPDPESVPERTKFWRRCVVDMELVSREVARLGGLDRFPRRAEALKELALAFQRTFGTHPELAAAVGDIVRTKDTCPKPSHVYGIAQGEQRASRVGCLDCDFTGFVSRADRRETLDGVREVDVAYPCHCRPPIPV